MFVFVQSDALFDQMSTTEAAAAVSGVERQDGAAMNKRRYRERHGGLATKKRFVQEKGIR